ncbi:MULTISPECIES: PH domain-containing protein [unclassified Curtobacterium]|uniref:PH domain-containing protein n=1 Tax=unclassified Curtobacterium TaxID=257496 RepID=UPI000DA9E153|nr:MULTISPECIES: PH domain-containing protein [unclassified Curtobacterium]PZE67021.1 hypothetical protein DEI83_06960 [Curtobacterium sp. MCBD17_021]WIB27258.1 PH domain-containing protein [Curtobacterium sp. MCSS17_015]
MPARIVATNMRRFAVALWVVAAALVVIGLVTNGPSAALLVPVPSLFTAWFAWVVLWRPRIELTADALVVVDVRRTTRFAWRRVRAVRTKYGLEVVTDQGEHRVWIAPRPNARLTLVRPGGSVPVDVDAAADEIRAVVPPPLVYDGDPPATVTAAPIVHEAHGWAIVALVVLGIAGSLAGARL